MKKLFLVRHAKSDWTYDGLPDIDRPLNERGYRDAHAMSKLMQHKNFVPDGMMSSSAVRAMNTALIFARNFKFSENRIIINSSLYESSADHFISQLAGLSDELKSVFVFAHNPTITQVAEILTNEKLGSISTCGIVCVEYKTSSWKALDSASFGWYDFPKNHTVY